MCPILHFKAFSLKSLTRCERVNRYAYHKIDFTTIKLQIPESWVWNPLGILPFLHFLKMSFMDNMNKYYTLWKFRVLTKETVPQIAADRAGWRSTWHRKDWVLRKKFKQWFIFEFNVLSTIVIYSCVLYIVLY